MFDFKDCLFNPNCERVGSEYCNRFCYPFVLLHGQHGTGGVYRSTRVPAKYKKCLFSNLPIKEDNPKVYAVIEKYLSNLNYYVNEKGVGLFLFAIPTPENKLGTGTGKTTTAVTLINEYAIYKTKQVLKKEQELEREPALYYRASEYQNLYNSQFRGSFENQQKASDEFYKIKELLKKVDLLCFDDIAIRDLTEAFRNELFEVIDYRANEGKATIYTSNHSLEKITELLGERIVSRIEGMALKLGFTGKDKRIGGLF